MTPSQFEEILEKTIKKSYKEIRRVQLKLYGTTLRVSVKFKWWVIDRETPLKEIRHDLQGVFELEKIPITSIEMPRGKQIFLYHLLKSEPYELAEVQMSTGAAQKA